MVPPNRSLRPTSMRSGARAPYALLHPLAIALSLLLLVASPMAAARVEIVLDVSGSMRAAAGNMSRMEAAQRAVKATVEGIDASSNVALRLYGHRLPSEPKEPSCRDTELVIPFGPLDRQRFISAVEQARPLGQTPLAYSLEQAAADFGELGDEAAAVILVSDGEESCGGDPARVACAFRERGLELTVHTVGFDVGAKAREQLQAVAQCTGGQYRDARDAGELADSLRQLTQAGLLIDKQREELGREVRGGNGFESAVALAPGTYRLDHHQRPNEYDYFAVDVPAGHLLRVTQEAYEVGVRIDGNTFREATAGHDHSPAGVTVFRPDRAKLGSEKVFKRGEQAAVAAVISSGAGGRYYIAIGHDWGPWAGGIHKGSPITVELVDQTDADSGTDAGDSDRQAVPIALGSHTGWLQALFSQEKDVFALTAVPGATYEVRVRPERDDPKLGITVTDDDGVVLGNVAAPNPGAAVRAEGVVAPRGGRLYFWVEDRRPEYERHIATATHRSPVRYTLDVAQTAGPAAGAAAVPAAAIAGADDGENAAATAQEGGSGLPLRRLGCVAALLFALLLAAGAVVAFLVLRSRRRAA
jgi:hypothetical protein